MYACIDTKLFLGEQVLVEDSKTSKLAQILGLEDNFFHLQVFAVIFSSGVICYNTIEVTSEIHIASGL